MAGTAFWSRVGPPRSLLLHPGGVTEGTPAPDWEGSSSQCSFFPRNQGFLAPPSTEEEPWQQLATDRANRFPSTSPPKKRKPGRAERGALHRAWTPSPSPGPSLQHRGGSPRLKKKSIFIIFSALKASPLEQPPQTSGSARAERTDPSRGLPPEVSARVFLPQFFLIFFSFLLHPGHYQGTPFPPTYFFI